MSTLKNTVSESNHFDLQHTPSFSPAGSFVPNAPSILLMTNNNIGFIGLLKIRAVPIIHTKALHRLRNRSFKGNRLTLVKVCNRNL